MKPRGDRSEAGRGGLLGGGGLLGLTLGFASLGRCRCRGRCLLALGFGVGRGGRRSGGRWGGCLACRGGGARGRRGSRGERRGSPRTSLHPDHGRAAGPGQVAGAVLGAGLLVGGLDDRVWRGACRPCGGGTRDVRPRSRPWGRWRWAAGGGTPARWLGRRGRRACRCTARPTVWSSCRTSLRSRRLRAGGRAAAPLRRQFSE